MFFDPEKGLFFMDYRAIIAIALYLAAFLYFLTKKYRKKGIISTKLITRCAIFASISIILYIVPAFNIAIPIFPSFLKIHIDEVPIFIAGFAYGPLSALLITVVKTLAKLPMSSTMMVGELADLLYTLSFVLPAAFIYKKHKSIKGAFISLGIGTIIQLVVASFFTTFVMLDFYVFMMGWGRNDILRMCQAVNPSVNNLSWPFLFFISLPFNAVKDGIVVVITFLLYKRLHTYIDRID